MKSTIDAAGRVLIPRALRLRLGLTGGEALEIRERDGTIEIEPAPTAMSVVEKEGGLVAVPEQELPPLTDEIVRATLERTRR
jgi:AbrB family looped-hinge helix DNA binding protein